MAWSALRRAVPCGVAVLACWAGPATVSGLPATRPAGYGQFRATMDRVFGAHRWRLTGGFRTPEQEEALRRQGAGTVPRGRVSAHSLGSPAAPGAYDVVVPGMAQEAAASMLRLSGAPFRVLAEAVHGGQGPHLHIEVAPARFQMASTRRPFEAAPPATSIRCASVYLRIIGGRPNPLLATCVR